MMPSLQQEVPVAASLSPADVRKITIQRRRYLGGQPARTRRLLKGIRAAIKDAVPQAVEVFSYGIPGFRLDRRPLLWYAGWTLHVSVYPMTTGIRKSLAPQLAKFEMSKGTIRFPLDKSVPMQLVKRMAKARAAEIRCPV
jgi:uncharacterized protein YdhG (YjbR/CyaY superfamily)